MYYNKALSNPQKINNSYLDKAIEKSGKLIRDYPDSKYVPEAILIMGNSFFYKKEYSNALIKYREIINYFPQSSVVSEAIFMTAKTYYVQEDFVSSMTFIKNNIDKTNGQWKDSCKVYLIKTYKDISPEKALTILNEMIKNDSDLWDIYKEKVLLFIKMDDADSLLFFMKNDINTLPRETKFSTAEYIFRYFMEQKDTVNMNEAIKIMKKNVPSNRLGTIKYYEFVLSEQKGVPDINLILDVNESELSDSLYRIIEEKIATYYLEEEKYDEAREVYDKLIKKYRDKKYSIYKSIITEIQTIMSDTSESLGVKDKKIFDIAEKMWTQMGETNKSLKYYEYVYDSFPESSYAPLAMLASAWIYIHNKGDTLKGKSLLQDIIKRYPNSDKSVDAHKLLKRIGYE